MAESHSMCVEGHVCQKPSGRECIERGCTEPAGTLWGPYWCPAHDKERLDRVREQLTEIADKLHAERSAE